ncbi:methionine aminopeptidase 1D, mitochondrial isoform X3 [Cryptotermes secundus]|uniref:methionine aminopeptidase 1D, mitochondrial isoform X3 n=1 Tax=Cryptotermes secundus TaxID=105785 RepID=UPI000CD7C317|nr:methionine aminopeptidase 1D, mitochondrial isoform X3 [Cryptotermes secundus]
MKLFFGQKVTKSYLQRRYFNLDDFWERSWKRRDFGSYNIVKPGFVSEGRSVPERINRPSYFDTSMPPPGPDEPEIKTEAQIKKMRDSCRLARFMLDSVGKYIKVYLNGFHGDCSAMFLVGEVDKDGKALVKATEQSLERAISICRPGEFFCNIGSEVELVARKAGFTVVPCFTGHGIGSYFHGPPDIYHCYNNYPGKMKTGMVFTIEPVLAQGSHEIVILEDGWTAVTLDNGRTAQFEHTVLITDDGVEILTNNVA